MNGPCSLHSRDPIVAPEKIVEAHVEGALRPLRATRKTVFHRYCEAIAVNNEPDIVYAGTDDILARTQKCAATILADECPAYVLAQYPVGEPRIISREHLQNYPSRYTQITA